MYKPTKREAQSGLGRVRHAEVLILQLPADHNGRGTWLLNYGVSDEAKGLRAAMGVNWIRETEAAETTKG
jgi:hypothetical protein